MIPVPAVIGESGESHGTLGHFNFTIQVQLRGFKLSALAPLGESQGLAARIAAAAFSPRPLGGEGGPQPASSSAGAGRVRGSKPNSFPISNRVAHSFGFAPTQHKMWGLKVDSGPCGNRGERRNRMELWVTSISRSKTPSPDSPRLMKAPDASHPLPQGGEGADSNITGGYRRNPARWSASFP